ncbi:MAG: hypothetical protein OTJ43_09820 [Dehalococcoidia bacterium]|nr:hypothetical protein [Dehalococcoidia bacterium]
MASLSTATPTESNLYPSRMPLRCKSSGISRTGMEDFEQVRVAMAKFA